MMRNNVALKRGLILQSFAPLFVLLLIKHFYLCMPSLVIRFIDRLFTEGFSALTLALKHPLLWDFILVALCLIWLMLTLFVFIGFERIQDSGFKSKGEKVFIAEERKDSGISFLVSFVLPLLISDISSFRYFLLFCTMLLLVLCLVARSNLFYQNPILALLGYRVYTFKFIYPAADVLQYENRQFIGITRGEQITDKTPIKRKYVADDVFLIYND